MKRTVVYVVWMRMKREDVLLLLVVVVNVNRRYYAETFTTHKRSMYDTFDPSKSKDDLARMKLQDDHPFYGMVDSNFTNAQDTKSTSGYVFYLYGCPIVTESKKQRGTSHSTTEAELIAASSAARRCTYLRRFLTDDFGLNLGPTLLGEDNQGCIDVSRGGGNHARLRHIRVADSYIYQEFKIKKTIQLRYAPSIEVPGRQCFGYFYKGI